MKYVYSLTVSFFICTQLYGMEQINQTSLSANSLGNTTQIEPLVDGVNLILSDELGHSELHRAAMVGDVDLITRLCDMDLSVSSIDELGRTPLHYAALNGHTNAVEELLKRRAYANHADNTGFTPMHAAAASGVIDVIELLYYYGGLINESTKKNSPEGSEPIYPFGRLSLVFALASGHMSAVRWFIEHGSLLDERDLLKDCVNSYSFPIRVTILRRKMKQMSLQNYADVLKELSRAESEEVLRVFTIAILQGLVEYIVQPNGKPTTIHQLFERDIFRMMSVKYAKLHKLPIARGINDDDWVDYDSPLLNDPQWKAALEKVLIACTMQGYEAQCQWLLQAGVDPVPAIERLEHVLQSQVLQPKMRQRYEHLHVMLRAFLPRQNTVTVDVSGQPDDSNPVRPKQQETRAKKKKSSRLRPSTTESQVRRTASVSGAISGERRESKPSSGSNMAAMIGYTTQF